MKKVLLILLSVVSCFAQEQVTQSLTINAPAPPVVNAGSISIQNTGASGQATYCYFIVAIFPIGKQSNSQGACIYNANNTLGTGGNNLINWAAVNGATGYDVIRLGTTPFNTSGSCTSCQVASNVSATANPTYTDNNTIVGSYTFSNVGSTQFTLFLDNLNFSNPRFSFLSSNSNTVFAFPTGSIVAGPYITQNSNPSFTGILRLARGDCIGWRNNANSADISLCKNTSDQLTFTSQIVNLGIIQGCGATSTCSPTINTTTAKTVYGSVPLVSGTPSIATITGISPAFTSSSSYVCTLTDATTATNNLLSVTNVSGSSFTITGPATITDTINYVCVGS